jgi:predicted ABC-type sugar transport system permease subunit
MAVRGVVGVWWQLVGPVVVVSVVVDRARRQG